MVVLLFIVPSVLLGLIFQQQSNRVIGQNYESIALDLVSRVADQLHFRVMLYETMIEGVARNELLNKNLAARHESMIENWETARYVHQSFSYVYDELPGILDFRIYHNNETLIEDGGILWKPGDRMYMGELDSDLFVQVMSGKRLSWRIDVNRRANMVEVLLSTRIGLSLAQGNGAVFLRMSMQSAFGDALAATEYSGSSCCVADGNGVVILATDSKLMGLPLSETHFGVQDFTSEDDASVLARSDQYGVHTRTDVGNGWTLYGFVPFYELRRSTDQAAFWQRVCIISVLMIGLGAIMLIVRNFTTRLRRLDQRMRTLSHGELNVSLPVQAQDDLGLVEERFNRMARHMQDLMSEMEIRKQREMEEAIRVMESYVNPHFLYNTLSLIRWRALDNDDPVLCDLVDDMTTYYRLSLSGGRSVVTIGDEITHLEAYIAIQQRRYDGQVDVDWDVDEAAMPAYTPKNILQTIVENSYVHGLIPEKPGNRITISVVREGERVRFALTDNGVGMDEASLTQVMSEDSELKSIGIHSVRKRLRMYYGDDMQMEIESRPGEGVRVFIEIPFSLEEPSTQRGV